MQVPFSLDTSSKELMGLLEKHLNELQSKPSARDKDKKDTLDISEEKSKDKKESNKKASASSAAAKAKSAAKKQAKTDAAAAELTPQAASTSTGFVRTIPSTTEPKETPALDMKETDASKKSQETVPAAATGEKKQILPKASIETPVDEPAYEVAEPNTVKSILARAKEVLKSLDEEKDEASEEAQKKDEAQKSAKKSDITRKSGDKEDMDDKEAKSVKLVAKLASNLVKTANKYKDGKGKATDESIAKQADKTKHASENVSKLRNEKKPKPGPKKSGLSATGPGRAGMGNTP